MYLRANETALHWAGALITEELHGEHYDDESRNLTVDEVEQVAQLLLVWVEQQKGKTTSDVSLILQEVNDAAH